MESAITYLSVVFFCRKNNRVILLFQKTQTRTGQNCFLAQIDSYLKSVAYLVNLLSVFVHLTVLILSDKLKKALVALWLRFTALFHLGGILSRTSSLALGVQSYDSLLPPTPPPPPMIAGSPQDDNTA